MLAPLKLRDFTFTWSEKDLPYLVGIINVTPDSFSDGGEAFTVEGALKKAQALLEGGAHILDIGGESTRPFSNPIPEEEEIQRVIPVIRAIRENFPSAIISIDTYKAKVAEKALEAGADLVNDISGGCFDPSILDVIKDYTCPYIVMHIKGTPKTMQINPYYEDILKEIKEYFKKRIETLLSKGISFEKIILDPGIGFGKTFQHNLTILKNFSFFYDLGRPLLLGFSRKSFIGEIIGKPPPERDGGTIGVAIFSYLQKVHLIRVHNVTLIRDALKTFKFLWKT